MPPRSASAATSENRDVFFNCPFDPGYDAFFWAIVFTIMRCGFRARCAREKNDGGSVRVEKIYKIIKECRLGIHDISCTELDAINGLPRFNMPLELGIFLGATKYGGKNHRDKICIIFDREPFRFQKFISDIAGQDIESHDGHVETLVEKLSDWLRQHNKSGPAIPGGSAVVHDYRLFQVDLDEILITQRLERPNMKFGDYTAIVEQWLLVLQKLEFDSLVKMAPAIAIKF